MVAKQRTMTLAEFLALPEEKPYLELIDGEVCQKPMATTAHGHAQHRMQLRLALDPATRDGAVFSEVTLPLPAALRPNARVPDVMYYRPGRVVPDPYPDEPADLAVEIRSPGQSVASQLRKLAFLREQGVPSTILVDPETHTLHVHDAGREWTAGRGETVVMPGLDGFSFPVDYLFRS